MKHKSTLVLMEQAVMLLVFAVAAVVCLRCFVWADTRSRQEAALDMALQQAQNAAELTQHWEGDLAQTAAWMGGSLEDGNWVLRFDEAWQQDAQGSYLLQVALCDSGHPLLGKASVSVTDASGGEMAFLTVCWQKEGPGGA